MDKSGTQDEGHQTPNISELGESRRRFIPGGAQEQQPGRISPVCHGAGKCNWTTCLVEVCLTCGMDDGWLAGGGPDY